MYTIRIKCLHCTLIYSLIQIPDVTNKDAGALPEAYTTLQVNVI